MKSMTMRTLRALSIGFVVIVLFPLIVTKLSGAQGLRIEKAVCGAKDSWRDVTTVLQNHARGDTLSVNISQPFQEIGGDPAPGQPKKLMIDYRFNNASYRLSLEEQYPVAFTVTLPSADAVAPGSDPLPAGETVAPGDGPGSRAPVPDIPANVATYVTSLTPGWSQGLSYFACVISLVALVGAVVALAQVRRIKREFNKS